MIALTHLKRQGLLLVFKHKLGILPSYLSDLIKVKSSSCTLRSTTKDLLTVPSVKTETFGKRAFSYAAPVVWNRLPEEIKSAKSVVCFKKNG